MGTKDYYLIIGVDRNVGTDGIRNAYRKLARKYHPDVSKDPDAEEKFKEVQKAYEILKCPDRRSAYDQRVSPCREMGGCNQLPMNYWAFYGGLQWMAAWNSWWAWRSFW